MSKRHFQVETTEAMLDSRRNVMPCDIDIATSNCGLLNSDNIITDRITCERIWSPTSPKRPMTIAFSPLDQSTISDEASHSQSRLPPFVDFNDITPARTSDCNYGGRLPSSQSMPSSLSSCSSASSSAPTNILPFLYLGSQHDALSENVITQHGITHVLNVSASCQSSHLVSDSNFLRIPVNDTHNDRLLPFFPQAFQFLESVRVSKGCVLVHCLAGVSRSPTLVIAFVMQHLKLSMDEAYRYVKSRRPAISPNFNFLGQLMEFETLLWKSEQSSSDDSSYEMPIKSSCCVGLKSNSHLPSGEFHPKPKRQLHWLTESAASPTTALAKLNFSHPSPISEIPQGFLCSNSLTDRGLPMKQLQLQSTNSKISKGNSFLYKLEETLPEEPSVVDQSEVKLRSAQFLAKIPLRRPNSIAITSFHFDMPCSMKIPQVKFAKDNIYEVQRQHSTLANSPAVTWNDSPRRCQADLRLMDCRDTLLQQVEEACKSRSLEDILMLSEGDMGGPKSLDITAGDFSSDRIDIVGRHWKREGHESSGSISSIGSRAGSMHGSLELMQVF